MDNRFKEPYSHPRWWYAEEGIPQCFDCAHFRGATKGEIRCDAFPDGIPYDVWKVSKERKIPPECTNEVMYTPIKTE